MAALVHDFHRPYPGAPQRCRDCRKAYWRQHEPCNLDVIQDGPEDPRDPAVKQRRIAGYMEESGIADLIMPMAQAKVLLRVISTEYDDDPLRFLPYGKEES